MDTIEHFEKTSERKVRRRTKKRHPAMRVSGRSVLTIHRTILKKANSVRRKKKTSR